MPKKRLQKRHKFIQQLSNKKDNSKKRKNIKSIAIIVVVFIVFIFSFNYCSVNEHNSIRKTVKNNSKTISAEVIHISRGRGSHCASFEFVTNGKKYTGKTFYEYKGQIGDIICVEYSTVKPEVNIYCNDTTPETFFDDVFISSLEVTGVFIVLLLVAFLYLKLKNPKKSIWEL
jgi:succinate dehydrogenase hydrophobic anchor subunit